MEREITSKKVSPLTFGTGVIFSQFHSTREKRFGYALSAELGPSVDIGPFEVVPHAFVRQAHFDKAYTLQDGNRLSSLWSFGAGVLGFGKRNRGGEILLRTHLGTNMAAHTGLGGFYFDGGAGGCTDSRKFCFEYNFSVAFPKITSRDFLGGMGLGIRSYF